MFYFKKIFPVVKILILSIAGFVCIYLVAEFCLSRICVPGETTVNPRVPIFIMTNGYHTDIVVPVKDSLTDWSEKIKFSDTGSKDTAYSYLAFGWGDKEFYLSTPTWRLLRIPVVLRACSGLNTSAMHVTFYHTMDQSGHCRKILINEEQYQRLAGFITGRFRADSSGNFIKIETNTAYGGSDAFYEAKGRYSLFYTCNSWVNDALESAGQKSCLWTAFDTGIFRLYK